MSPAPPSVSVVMPVHNGARYLDASIASIVAQTLTDIELVILDDASTDATPSILVDWAHRDPRITIVESRRLLGLVGSSNAVVAKARAAVCARMDADDIAHPDRLRRQWEVMRQHDDVSLVGTLWVGIDEAGRTVRPRDRWRLLNRSPFPPFPHGSIMFRRSAFQQIGGYREACIFWEDLDLCLRFAAHGRVLVLPDVLYRYRFHINSTRLLCREEQVERAIRLMERCLALHRSGGDYTEILGENGVPRSDGAHPFTLASLGSSRLWSGHSPAILGHLGRIAASVPKLGTLWLLLLGSCGGLSPVAFRWLLSRFIRARDSVASLAIRGHRPVEWHAVLR